MVSRGGRSKGCSNCRRRRIKCDETPPTCQRCHKRGLECDGPRSTTWINASAKSTPISGVQSIPGQNSNLPNELSLVAFRDDICLTYTRKKLLRGGPVELACNAVFLKSDMDPGIDLLKSAILSLATTFYGSRHQQKALMNTGYKQYGSVLLRLNQHLAQTQLQTTNETLLTALTCMLLEIFLPTGPNHFLKHIQGIETILELRGPPTCPYSQDTLVLFHGLRVLSIISGLATSRASIYAREEWKNLPRLHEDDAGQLRHQVFDILADCTQLMSRRDFALQSADPSHRLSVIEDAECLFQKLERLHPKWEAFNEKEMHKPSSDVARKVRIANFRSATVHMLYYTGYILIVEILNTLQPSLNNVALRASGADNLMKSVELKLFEQSTGAFESNTIGFVATKIAWQAIGGYHTPEGRRLAKLIRKNAKGIFAVGAWETDVVFQTPHPNELALDRIQIASDLERPQEPTQASLIDNGPGFAPLDSESICLVEMMWSQHSAA
ncbi:hypothetical protein BU24DRAFT_403585 [Aaosphaeria arxii CBS 175.79]|uniref:Zn(2)-C6 fungal-type domain-containing protein n=1 Tax=Aaosphaeria arxii CBS 175.79 TaxID=1450172 RepID=A0A6A5Y4G8_9PLEO|nr:uncharacterized protein BU24DRAFT_403585 [Aaosphaeria arxii CBS 175.79]KAF2020475.1 hypothetical protein BU24DRAFT_403585 [Aaosphaeria arxii CBS 175.79]